MPQFSSGQFNPQTQNIGQLNDPTQMQAGQIDVGGAMQGMGAIDPTQALQNQLSGNVNMDSIGAMQQAAGNRAMVGYGDMVQDAGRMFSEQINPAIRQGAQVAGQ